MSGVLTSIESGSREEAFFQLAGDPESLDALLDHPKLLEAILDMGHPVDVSAELYFYVLVRHTLKEAGLDHIELADYVAATLAEYAMGNPFQSGSNDALQVDGMPYHVDFLQAINEAAHYDRFYLHVKCGNQFLVLTGMFPGFLKHRESRRGAPGVRFYEGVAQESYRTAMQHPLADEFALCEVYDLLADQFRVTRRALNRMTKEYMWLGG